MAGLRFEEPHVGVVRPSMRTNALLFRPDVGQVGWPLRSEYQEQVRQPGSGTGSLLVKPVEEPKRAGCQVHLHRRGAWHNVRGEKGARRGGCQGRWGALHISNDAHSPPLEWIKGDGVLVLLQ